MIRTVELQLCQEKDLATLVSLSRETYRQNYSYLWEDQGETHIEEQFNPATMKSQLLSSNENYYLVRADKISIGLIRLVYLNGLASFPPASCVEIQKIYLLDQYKGKGIGKAVIQLIENIARQQDKTILWLMVMDSSPAKKFYEKCGYVTHSKSSYQHVQIIPDLQGMYVMVKQLR